MIEIQILDKELYEELKIYSNYNSDITQVCSFRNELKELLEKKGLEIEISEEIKGKEMPTLTIQGRNIMKLNNAPAEMLYFVGVRSEFDPTIPLKNMNEVNHLIKNNLVSIDNKFKKVYSQLSYRDKIDSLICSNVKFYGKGKLTDYIDGNLTLQSMGFSGCSEKPIDYKFLKIKILEPLKEEDKSYVIVGRIIGESVSRKIYIKFYTTAAILKSIAFVGNEIGISIRKLTQDFKGDYSCIDPIILPNGLELQQDIMITPPNRKIPIDFYRNAYYEFICRYQLLK